MSAARIALIAGIAFLAAFVVVAAFALHAGIVVVVALVIAGLVGAGNLLYGRHSHGATAVARTREAQEAHDRAADLANDARRAAAVAARRGERYRPLDPAHRTPAPPQAQAQADADADGATAPDADADADADAGRADEPMSR
jgi:hypothetical protein